MGDSDGSDEDTCSSDVSSRASGDDSRGSSTHLTSEIDSESGGTHDASDNEYGGGQAMSDEDPGGQAPAYQLVKKQECVVNETDGGKAPSPGQFFATWDEHLKKHGKKHRCARDVCVATQRAKVGECIGVQD